MTLVTAGCDELHVSLRSRPSPYGNPGSCFQNCQSSTHPTGRESAPLDCGSGSSSQGKEEAHPPERCGPFTTPSEELPGRVPALNLWLGVKFYFWVRQFETGVFDVNLRRPPGVEGWLPIAGLMNLKYLLLSGEIPRVHPAAMFLLISFLAISFLFRKAFCSWLCPIGTFSEYLWRLGHRLFRRNFNLRRWPDLPLRGLKYFLLGFFVWSISSMSVEGIRDFMQSPYGLIADVKMLNFLRRKHASIAANAQRCVHRRCRSTN